MFDFTKVFGAVATLTEAIVELVKALREHKGALEKHSKAVGAGRPAGK